MLCYVLHDYIIGLSSYHTCTYMHTSMFHSIIGVSVGFGSPTYTASESDCFTSVNVSLLAGSTDIPLNFNLTTTSSSAAAQAGQDFVSVFRMPVTINPRSEAAQVNIQLLDDNIFEKDPESFVALLEPGGEDLPQGVTIDNNTTNIYIEDNDFFTTQGE